MVAWLVRFPYYNKNQASGASLIQILFRRDTKNGPRSLVFASFGTKVVFLESSGPPLSEYQVKKITWTPYD